MNTENQQAYVLHTRDYRESSQLVDLFSRDFGRLRAVAKGARGKRKSGGHQLQAFTPLSLSWRGKGDLKNLTAVEASGNSAVLQGEMLYIGLYLNELLVRLLPEYVPHESLFDRYGELIVQLGISNDPEPLLRRSPESKESGFLGEYLLAMAEDNYQLAEVRRCAKRLLRTALQAQLGERPLLSRQLFHQARVPISRTNMAEGE